MKILTSGPKRLSSQHNSVISQHMEGWLSERGQRLTKYVTEQWKQDSKSWTVFQEKKLISDKRST